MHIYLTLSQFLFLEGLEFAYTQAPQFMQGLIMGLFLMTSGLGSYLASLIVAIVGAWRKDGMIALDASFYIKIFSLYSV